MLPKAEKEVSSGFGTMLLFRSNTICVRLLMKPGKTTCLHTRFEAWSTYNKVDSGRHQKARLLHCKNDLLAVG